MHCVDYLKLIYRSDFLPGTCRLARIHTFTHSELKNSYSRIVTVKYRHSFPEDKVGILSKKGWL